MDEWQSHEESPKYEATTSRQTIALMLIGAIEQAESAYVMSQIDHDEYVKQLQDVNDKLSIVGLTLAIKPWKDTTNRL